MVINCSVPALEGLSEKAKLESIERYLYELNDQLRFILGNLEIDNFSAETRNALSLDAAGKRKAEKEFGNYIEQLRQQIINTSTEIEREIESVRNEMSGHATYVSEQFGRVEEEYLKITDEDALGEMTIFKTVSNINGYVLTSMNYIKTGLLETSGQGDEYGVEIGDIIGNGQGMKLRLVKNKVSFYENNTEVAYITGKELCITQAKIKMYIYFGGFKINVTDGIAFDWEGDEDDG